MALIDDLNKISKNIRNLSKTTNKKIEDNAHEIVVAVSEKIDDLKDDLESWMLKRFNNVKKVIKGSLDDLRRSITSVKNSISTIKNTVTGFVKSLKEQAKNSIVQLRTLATSIVTKVVSKVTNVIAITFNTIKNFLSNAVRVVG
ncbi:hypothetical protein LCGC14_1364650, partial [marine sediment metagenome]